MGGKKKSGSKRLYSSVLLYYNKYKGKGKEGAKAMSIQTTYKGTTITLGGHTRRDIREAAQKASSMWKPGKWAEVCTMIGDAVFWITPSGKKYWDL